MSVGNKNTKLLVRSQLPEFVTSDYPKFVEFLKAYYEFVNQDYSPRIESLRDADNTSQELLGFLRRELLKNFPTSYINDRKLINTIRELYTRKGNLDSIKLLFKLFFNDSVIIRQPGTQIIRASDGKWSQYYAITVSQINWDLIAADIEKAAVQLQPQKGLFDTVISGWKVGDINRTGTVTSADADVIRRYSFNPGNVTPTQRTHIEDILIPQMQGNTAFAGYLFSTVDYSDIVPEVSRLVIENKFGRFTPTISYIEVEENKKIRIFFKYFSNLKIVTGQLVDVTGEHGAVVFTGKHEKTPSGLRVINPGQDWQKGQVITIPGTVTNTVARVKETDENSGIKSVEILEYGFSHDENMAIVISPYPVKPSENSAYDVDTVITNLSPLSYTHTITLRDNTEGISETVYGEMGEIDYAVLSQEIGNAVLGVEPAATLFNIVVSGYKLGDINQTGTITATDARSILTYFSNPSLLTPAVITRIRDVVLPYLVNLVDTINPNSPPVYTGILYSIVNPFVPSISSSTTESNSVSYNYSELTFEEWVNSRATLEFTRDDIIKTKGTYTTDESIVSNSESRLQDNYFYQLFSYLIETTKTESEVQGILNQFHPAGMKYFLQTNKQNSYSIRDIIESYRAISTDIVFLVDFTTNTDVVIKSLNKGIVEILDSYLELAAKVFTKVVSDSMVSSDAPAKDFTKISTDTHTVSDSEIKTFGKNPTDLPTPVDSDPIRTTQKAITDTPIPEDLPAKVLTRNKYDNESTASLDEGTFLSISAEGYGSEEYILGSENYSQLALEAYIG